MIDKFQGILQLLGCIIFASLLTLDRSLIHDLMKCILTEKKLLFYWPIALTFMILLPKIKIIPLSSQNSIRKFYHFVSMVLFIPAAFWSLDVLKIGMAFAATLFLCIEVIRTNLMSKGPKSLCGLLLKLNEFMENCRNELDEGEMILSHLYLLLGCAIPFWLNSSKTCKNCLSNFSGVISLGIGDSLAAIGGKILGKTKWNKNTKKTIEGSICGCFGMFIFWWILNEISSNYVPLYKLIFISIASSIWEASITLNDNLTLPIFTFILIKYL